MKHFYHISFKVYEDDVVVKNGSFGLMHTKECSNTTIKTIIKRMLPPGKRTLDIAIIKNEPISEEEATRRFDSNIMNVSFKQRLVR